MKTSSLTCFYHIRLRCFVVIDLKMGPFKPEHAGKMNFYLAAIDTSCGIRMTNPVSVSFSVNQRTRLSLNMRCAKQRDRLEYRLTD